MLTRLEIDGFKSFEVLQVDLLPFTVVLGNNAAGKSNLFDAIQLLSRLATQDVAEACKGMRGEPLELFRQVAGGERVRQIRLAAEVLVDPVVRDPWGSEVTLSHTRIRYEVTLERREIRGMERIQVAQESARPILRKEDRWAERVQPSAGFRLQHLRYARTNAWLSTVHGDGAGDPVAARAHLAQPALDLLAGEFGGRGRGVAVVPIRETEAWAICDGDALREVFGSTLEDRQLGLPPSARDAETVVDPKRLLAEAFGRSNPSPRRLRRGVSPMLNALGGAVSLVRLRQLPAFQLLEAELRQALKDLRVLR